MRLKITKSKNAASLYVIKSTYENKINSSKIVEKLGTYALRCFLLRLGFIGTEYKAARGLLIKDVPGNSAFRNGKLETAEEIEIL